MLRYLDSDNYYRFVWDADSKQFRLELRAGGVLKVLATRSGSLTSGTYHTIEVYANGSQISAFASGNELLSITNTTLVEGLVALYTSSSPNTAFDGIMVTDLQTGNILLKDDFQSSILNGWTTIDEAPNGPSSWSVSNQALRQKSEIGYTGDGDSLGTFALYTRGSWTDYRLTLTMKSMDGNTIGVLFRLSDNFNYYRFSWDNQEHIRRLEKRVNGAFTTLAEDSVPYVIGRNYQVSIVAQGSKLQVLVDGQFIFSVTDSTLNGGTIALYSRWNTGANFDNISVADLKNNSVLLWDDFNDGHATGWTIIDDEGTQSGPSAWSVANGSLVQTSNIGDGSSLKLGTFTLY
jgi:hypothetical protein